MKIKFDCAQDQFEALHRATNKTVTVDEAALEALLRDHSKLIAHHRVES